MVRTGGSLERQRGVALAYLLWMLAALSLLVSGIMTLSMGDVRSTALQLDQARTQAVGTGVAHLLLRDMQQPDSGSDPLNGESEVVAGALFTREYRLGGYRAVGRAIPVAGLISLRDAPAELLALLFEHAGGLPAAEARALGEAVVNWREQSEPITEGEVPAGFLAIEDLLRVPAMTRSVYDRVRFLVHAQPSGAAGVNPRAAPGHVLSALAGGDTALVDDVLKRREEGAGRGGALSSGLAQEYLLESDGGNVYCLEIDVFMEDGRVLQQRIWAEMTSSSGAVPWRFTRVEPVVAIGRVDKEA